jgi:hypothetical protein
LVWIACILLADAVPLPVGELARQLVLGALTWARLAGRLRREPALVRVQTAVVVLLATTVEYTFSPLLEAYTYRIGTVPAFVPPGHGLVYLAALAFGRSALVRAYRVPLTWAVAAAGGGGAAWGLLLSPRPDALGAIWVGCQAGFLLLGPSRTLYLGAFLVVSWLELIGTALGTWAWAARDPVLGVITQGNPPSGAAGGYGWFDLYAVLLAPRLLLVPGRLRGHRRLLGGAEPPQQLVVQQAVGGQGVAAERAVLAGQRGEPATGLDDDRHQGGHVVDGQLRLGGDVDGALGQQHVGPEVAVAPGPPDLAGELQEGVQAAALLPPAQ